MIDSKNMSFEDFDESIFKSLLLIEKIQVQLQNDKLSERPLKSFYLNSSLELLIGNLKLIEQSNIIIENDTSDYKILIEEVKNIPKYIYLN